MSQSPVDQITEQSTLRYRQGWRALNRLLHENRAFSGNERHCAFLNTGRDSRGRHRPFADVSAAIGFDLPDDGRGLAFADWDFDGDLDVWTTSRTAPRVRLLANSTDRAGHFVSFRLEGDGRRTNRDAIGARLELYVKGDPVPRIRTLHAGHAFISQSSRWLHFGLGKESELAKLAVQWPGGAREEIGGLAVDRFYTITQGQGVAIPWTPPGKNRVPLTPTEPSLPDVIDEARIVVPPGMQVPTLRVMSPGGSESTLERTGDGLLLVNVWASYCVPCQEELAEWAHAEEQFRKAGIEVVALNTDGADGSLSEEEARRKAETAIRNAQFPFPWFPVSPTTVQALDIFHHATVDLWTPLPVPSSFLIDEKGEAVAIYRGPVDARQIVADAKLVRASPEARRNAAVPFPEVGRWVEKPYLADSLRVAAQFMDRDESTMARDYLDRLIAELADTATTDEDRRHLGDARLFYSALLAQAGARAEAIKQLEAARELLSNDVRVRSQLAQLYQQAGKPVLAASEMEAALRINPRDLELADRLGTLYAGQKAYKKAAERFTATLVIDPRRAGTRFQLANTFLADGYATQAVEQYKQTLRANPRFLEAANRLARILTTHPDAEVRSAQEGLILATRLCALTRNQNPRFLDTLAGAQANAGQHAKAVQTAEQALALYRKEERLAANARELEARLPLFRAGKAYREEAWK